MRKPASELHSELGQRTRARLIHNIISAATKGDFTGSLTMLFQHLPRYTISAIIEACKRSPSGQLQRLLRKRLSFLRAQPTVRRVRKIVRSKTPSIAIHHAAALLRHEHLSVSQYKAVRKLCTSFPSYKRVNDYLNTITIPTIGK